VPPLRFALPPGELAVRAEAAVARLTACDLCGRACGADRTAGPGVCRIGRRARVASCFPHHGEEACLRGWNGSGTIFFGGCNLRCRFCQNWDISQRAAGREVEPAELAALMLELHERGCHNLNLVSPSHMVAQVLEALALAGELTLPVVWNSGGYDSLRALALLDGVVDIYMPDVKYADAAVAQRWSGVADYPTVSRAALREMHRQVGDLRLDADGIATHGLLVRHLVLPEGLAGTTTVARWLAELSRETALNLMAQYRPAYRAAPPLHRPPTAEEMAAARQVVAAAGLARRL